MIPIGYSFIENIFCLSVVLALMCLNEFLCLPRVLSSAGVKRSLIGTVNNLFCTGWSA